MVVLGAYERGTPVALSHLGWQTILKLTCWAFISQNVFIDLFYRVNSPTKKQLIVYYHLLKYPFDGFVRGLAF